MSKSAIIEGFPFRWQVQLINQLNLRPLYWVANDIGTSDAMPENCVFVSAAALINANFEVPGIGDFPYLDDEILIQDAAEIDRITRIIRIRPDLYGHKLRNDEGKLRRYVYRQIAFWFEVIRISGAEFVLFEAPPHLVHHYALYYAAKKCGLKTLIVYRAGEPARFLIADDIHKLAHGVELSNDNKQIPIKALNRPPDYAVLGPSASKSSNWMLAGLKAVLRHPSKLKNFRQYWGFAVVRIRTKFWKTYFSFLHRKYEINQLPESKFIYFPLHESPEDTTYPSAWNFEDQLFAIEYLSEILPDAYSIVVKEHPNQRFWRGRALDFYRELTSLKSVYLIENKWNSFELINASIAVATLTGQAGWEALTNNKPVIHFGQAWYTGAPGAVHISVLKKMAPESIESKLGETLSRGELEVWYKSFCDRSIPGFVNNIYSTESALEPDTNMVKSFDRAIHLAMNLED